MSYGTKTLGVLLGLLFLTASSGFASQVEVSEGTLMLTSSYIIAGSVIAEHSYWDSAHELIYTDYTVKVAESLKGNLASSEVKVTVLGGVVGEIKLVVTEQPVFQVGEKVLLYLEKPADGKVQLTCGSQGKYTIVNGVIKETGEKIETFKSRLRTTLDQTPREE